MKYISASYYDTGEFHVLSTEEGCKVRSIRLAFFGFGWALHPRGPLYELKPTFPAQFNGHGFLSKEDIKGCTKTTRRPLCSLSRIP